MLEKIVTALCLSLLAGAMLACHINQGLRLDVARLEEARLDSAGVIGWIDLDPATKQLVFFKEVGT